MGKNSKNYQRCFTKPGIGLKMILVKNEDINVTSLKVLDVYFGLGMCFWPKMSIFGQNTCMKILKTINAASQNLELV